MHLPDNATNAVCTRNCAFVFHRGNHFQVLRRAPSADDTADEIIRTRNRRVVDKIVECTRTCYPRTTDNATNAVLPRNRAEVLAITNNTARDVAQNTACRTRSIRCARRRYARVVFTTLNQAVAVHRTHDAAHVRHNTFHATQKHFYFLHATVVANDACKHAYAYVRIARRFHVHVFKFQIFNRTRERCKEPDVARSRRKGQILNFMTCAVERRGEIERRPVHTAHINIVFKNEHFLRDTVREPNKLACFLNIYRLQIYVGNVRACRVFTASHAVQQNFAVRTASVNRCRTAQIADDTASKRRT